MGYSFFGIFLNFLYDISEVVELLFNKKLIFILFRILVMWNLLFENVFCLLKVIFFELLVLGFDFFYKVDGFLFFC